MAGITAGLSLRGKIAVRMIFAAGAFLRQRAMSAFMPAVMSAIFASSAGWMPTLLVPARITMTFGFTPSNSPCSSRQRMCSIRSAPQPKSPAFQPKEVGAPVCEHVCV